MKSGNWIEMMQARVPKPVGELEATPDMVLRYPAILPGFTCCSSPAAN
jgi:hypothetical protein